jgi:uncharacterized protein GlcG (DUF336 family)
MSTFLHRAQSAIQAGLDHAAERQLVLVIVVVDATGSVCAAARMDGMRQTAFDVARAKANTALTMRATTAQLKETVPLETRITMGQLFPHIAYLGGGVPIVEAQQLLGAIGVGGASEAEDAACAEQCVAQFLAS